MITITWTISNIRIMGFTPEQVVYKLSQGGLHSGTKMLLKTYMEDVAKRVEIWNGAVIRTVGATEFLTDLEMAGLISMNLEVDNVW